MQTRQRTNENAQAQPGGSAPDAGAGELDQLTAQGAAFAAAGHQAIDKALSGDSQAFMQANRQQGGQ